MDLAVYAESSSSNTKGRGKLRSVMGMNQDSNEVTFSGGEDGVDFGRKPSRSAHLCCSSSATKFHEGFFNSANTSTG